MKQILKLLTWHFTYNITKKDIRGIQINSVTKNRVIIQDWQSYIVIPKEDLVKLKMTTKEFGQWLLDNHAKKRKRVKITPYQSFYC